jgi:hypothetical protein
MANIKKTILKESKKITNKTELDITPEELANLTLFKVLNLPYFENVHNFMSLHYNVFEEISLGLLPLNNVKGYSNENVKSFVVKMNMKEQVESKVDVDNQILKHKDYEIFKTFMNIINTSNTLDEVVKKVDKMQEADSFYFNKVMNITNTSSYEGNKLVRAVHQLALYTEDETYAEYLFEQKTKIKHYRGSGFSNDIKNFVFDFHSLKELATKPFKEILEKAGARDIEALTGVPELKKEDLKNFHKTHPEEYNNSVYKIFKEKEDLVERCKDVFDLNYYKKEVKIMNKMYAKVFQNNTAEQLLKKYEEPIKSILQVLSKTYPQLFKDVKDSPYEIKRFVHTTAKAKEEFIEKEQPLDFFQDNYMSSLSYPSVRGFLFYKNEYRSEEGIYVAAHNGLEEIASGEGHLMKNLDFGGHRMMFNNVRLNRIYEAGRTVDVQIKQEIIEDMVKMAVEKNCPFVYDIIERDHKGQEKFNNEMRTCIQNMKEKYPDVIFLNDCVMLNDKERLETDMKGEIIAYLLKNNMSYDKIVLANKQLEAFYQTEGFEKLSKLDYMERRSDSLRKETFEKIITSISTPKSKAKLSM